jgi:SAM-dependent methyltransferase
MNTTVDRHQNQLKALMLRWLERSPPRQAALRRLSELVGPTGGRRCLAVLAEDVLVSHRLSEQGGTWDFVGVLEDPGPVAATLIGDRMQAVREGKLPYDNAQFDVVMLDEVLEYFEEDAAFIGECHRVLKPSGVLILKAAVFKRWSLLRVLRRLFGFAPAGPERAREGYHESKLFSALKDGFDTEDVQTWSRFFAELVEIKTQFFMVALGAAPGPLSGHAGDNDRAVMAYRRLVQLQAVMRPFAWLAAGLDGLLFFTRGYRMALRARHRSWKPRRAPTLTDGRSIADAAINTKIGTAAPF